MQGCGVLLLQRCGVLFMQGCGVLLLQGCGVLLPQGCDVLLPQRCGILLLQDQHSRCHALPSISGFHRPPISAPDKWLHEHADALTHEQ